jgi:hypothetical protein
MMKNHNISKVARKLQVERRASKLWRVALLQGGDFEREVELVGFFARRSLADSAFPGGA